MKTLQDMMKKAMPCLLFSLALLALAGCTTNLDTKAQQERQRSQNAAAIDELLSDIHRRDADTARQRRLEAAQLALMSGDVKLLGQILSQLPASLARVTALTTDEQNQQAYKYLRLLAELALLEGNPAAAFQLLDSKPFINLTISNQQQVTLGYLRARAWAIQGNLMASARELIHLDQLVNDHERQVLHQRLMTILLRLDEIELREQAKQSMTSDSRGWLSLAALIKGSEYDPARQLTALTNWLRVWSNHPAASQVPDMQRQLADIVQAMPRHLALLLPLEGELGNIGHAIKNGFIASHYLQHQRQAAGGQLGWQGRFDDAAPETRLSILDTSKTELASLIEQAQSLGADMIIGPLDRQRVTDLASMRLPMPVLALNRTLDGSTNRNLYQFGLTPEDESSQVADQVINESRFKGLVIAPRSAWGDRNLSAFSTRFTQLGGTIVDTARFDDQRDYSDMIKALLNVDASEARHKSLQEVTGQGFEFTARRRQDISFVFLLANAVQARSINPTLDFYYADDIPVYATSHISDLGASRIDLLDLNGIRFCDLPWKLGATSQAQETINATWADARGHKAPFYALGLDVHRLYPRLMHMQSTGRNSMNGATGTLRLDSGNVIRRTLPWAEFRDGEVALLPAAVSSAASQ